MKNSPLSLIFTLRDSVKVKTFDDFKTDIGEVKEQLSADEWENILNFIYDNKREHFLQYLTYLSQIHSELLQPSFHFRQKRNILEQLCLKGIYGEVKGCLKLIETGRGMGKYDFYRLFHLSQLNSEKSNGFDHALMITRELLDHDPHEVPVSAARELVSRAIEKQLYAVATCFLEQDFYTPCNSEDRLIFVVAAKPWGRKDKEKMTSLIMLLIQKNISFDRRQINTDGETLLDRIPKEYQSEFEDILKRDEERRSKKDLPVDVLHSHAKQKGKSEFGGRGIIKSDHQIMKIGIHSINIKAKEQRSNALSIHTAEDEFQIQKKANKIYKALVTQKQADYKFDSLQTKKEKRENGSQIMTSDELKGYLEEEIKFETANIKRENDKCKQFYEELISKIRETLTSKLPGNIKDVKIFGSFATNLCLPESDIDMVLIPVQTSTIQPLALLEEVERLLLNMREEVDQCRLIKTASVPIIKVHCTDRYNKKQIDITLQDINHNGLEFVDLINHYLKMYTVLEPLIFILKKYIYSCNLFAPYTGGLSSCGLILMIVAHLQNEEKIRRDSKTVKEHLIGDLLISFLKFYGFKMDYINKCIVVYSPDAINWDTYAGCVYRHTQILTHNCIIEPKLVIIDPLNQANNVGRATHKIKQIRMAFEIGFISIHTNTNCKRRSKCQLYQRIKNSPTLVDYEGNNKPCCILKRMFKCTDKFISNDFNRGQM